jgi:hypothetical protein
MARLTSESSRLVAAGELIVHQDGRVETARRRRRRAKRS